MNTPPHSYCGHAGKSTHARCGRPETRKATCECGRAPPQMFKGRRPHAALQTLHHLLLIAPDRTVEFFRRYIVPTLARIAGSILNFTDCAAQFTIAHCVFHVTILHLSREFS